MLQPMNGLRGRWVGVGILAVALAGCSGGTPTENISGKVTYRNTGLPGGLVTLVAPDGKSFAGDLSEAGDYSIANVPAGTYKVTVDNANLQMQDKMSLPPGSPAGAKLPDDMPKKPGRYVAIPDKVKRSETTDLGVTVVKGQQSYPIELK